jgi:hypothetical protein
VLIPTGWVGWRFSQTGWFVIEPLGYALMVIGWGIPVPVGYLIRLASEAESRNVSIL